MSIKKYNILMFIATIIAWLGFFIIINRLDPTQGSLIVFGLFYLSLFLSILGTLSLLGFWFRTLWNSKRVIPRIMAVESFRQGVIFSAFIIIALWLQAGRVLTWWNMVILILLATVVEFAILAFRQNEEKQHN